MESRESTVRRCAVELGFDLVGITSADRFATEENIALSRIKDGYMDGLSWYTEARVKRGCSPNTLMEGAKSIISVGMSYHVSSKKPPPNQLTGKVAMYSWGKDYHKVMKDRMRAFALKLNNIFGESVITRSYVDDGPMLDRAVAQRAGIGWFGKNTNILTASHGSWVFLGQVITDLELRPDTPTKKTCGNCVRCIDACPTGAIVAPFVLDNSKCISYLTIENRGPIPRNLRPLMYDWVFGCDICQDVCPVNIKGAYTTEQEFLNWRFTTLNLLELLEMEESEFEERFRNSPIKRAKRVGLQRNACVALGNACDESTVPALSRALETGHPLVRGHAAWALGKIGNLEAQQALRISSKTEEDPIVLEEIAFAISMAPASKNNS